MTQRAGILTFHSSLVEGAILQAYCLAQHLAQNLPTFSVDIIDHRYATKSQAFRSRPDARTKALDRFINHALPLSERRFESDDSRATLAYIQENYDAVIVGSDEVWKLQYRSGLAGLLSTKNAPTYTPFPNVYWPDPKLSIPKIAYAACIGKTEWQTIPAGHRKVMCRVLDAFQLLGIRDRRTRAFLEWLDPGIAGRAEWVPDPAFSVDLVTSVDREALRIKLQSYGVDFSRPRLGVVVRDTPVVNDAVDTYKKLGYQAVAITEANSVADVSLIDKDLSPLEWAATFGLMDACMTQRMHGAVFCILNGTPMLVVDFWKNARRKQSKLFDLADSFGLMDFYYSADEDATGRLEQACKKLLAGEWPSDTVANVRRLFRHRSGEFAHAVRQLLEGA